MANSWSFLFDELNMDEHSKYYYEYDRNSPNRKMTKMTKSEGWSTDEGKKTTNDGILGGAGDDRITFNVNVPDLPESPKNDNGFWKYHEDVILKEIREYLGGTYNAHYASQESKTQTLDLIEGIGDAEPFCRSNAIKYLSRFGKKGGKSKQDILKAIHYCILLYHFAGLCNENSTPYETF